MRKEILLDCNVLNNVSYRLLSDDNVYFHSDDKIYKKADVLFFDQTGEQIKAHSDHNGPILVATKTPVPFGELVHCGNGYSIYQVIVKENLSYEFDGKKYDFRTIREPGLDGEKCEGVTISSKTGINCDVFYSVSSLLLETTRDKEDLELFIDNNKVPHASIIDYGTLENGISQIRYEFLDKLEDGYHQVYIFDHHKMILQINFFLNVNHLYVVFS